MRIAKEDDKNRIKENEDTISFTKEGLSSTYQGVRKIGAYVLTEKDKAKFDSLRPIQRKKILKKFSKTEEGNASFLKTEYDKVTRLPSLRERKRKLQDIRGKLNQESEQKIDNSPLKQKVKEGLQGSSSKSSVKNVSKEIAKKSLTKSTPYVLAINKVSEEGKKISKEIAKKNQEQILNRGVHRAKKTMDDIKKSITPIILFAIYFFVSFIGISGVIAIVLFAFLHTGSRRNNSAVPQGLTEFSYFLVYESGGEGLYRAVLGDSGHAFGGYQFDTRYDLQPFLQWAYQKEPTFCSSFAPYLSVSRDSLLGNQGLANAWIRIYDSDAEKFSRLQDDYVKETKLEPLIAYHKARGLDLSTRPEVVKGLCVSIHNRKGYETSSLSYISRSGVTNETSDEEFIIKVAESFGSRPGNIHDRYLVDYSSAACGLICEKNMALSILRSPPLNLEGGEVLNSVPYYNQGDYPHVGFNGRSVASSGCGITSFSMIASYFCGRAITPEETAPWAMSHGANTVTNWGAFAILAPEYGVTLESQGTGPLWGGSAQPIMNALANGKLVIGSQTGGHFNPSHGGHYIVYAGITGDGKIMVNDPGNRSKVGVYDQVTAFSHCKQFWIFTK